MEKLRYYRVAMMQRLDTDKFNNPDLGFVKPLGGAKTFKEATAILMQRHEQIFEDCNFAVIEYIEDTHPIARKFYCKNSGVLSEIAPPENLETNLVF